MTQRGWKVVHPRALKFPPSSQTQHWHLSAVWHQWQTLPVTGWAAQTYEFMLSTTINKNNRTEYIFFWVTLYINQRKILKRIKIHSLWVYKFKCRYIKKTATLHTKIYLNLNERYWSVCFFSFSSNARLCRRSSTRTLSAFSTLDILVASEIKRCGEDEAAISTLIYSSGPSMIALLKAEKLFSLRN